MKITNKIYFANINIYSGKIQAFSKNSQTGPSSQVSSESSHHWQPTHQSPTSWKRANCNMNLYTKMKEKMKGKKTKALKKKIVTVGEIFITGALLTAGGNMVNNLSEDSSPQISAGEVNWIQDQGKALIEFKTNQRD